MRGHESNVDRRAYETHGVSRHPHWLRIEDSNLGLPVQSRTSVPLDQSALSCCPARDRTWDCSVNNRPLYRLSYRASAPEDQWHRKESNLALPGFNRPRRLQRFSAVG